MNNEKWKDTGKGEIKENKLLRKGKHHLISMKANE